ncbi:hypothetical protein [Neobacillus sp. Marseille-QA0830]
MKINIQRNKWLQYALIYLMLIVNQSSLYHNFLNDYNYIIVIFFLVLTLFSNKWSKHIWGFLLFLLITCLVVRLYTLGGVGVTTWFTWASMILVAYHAIKINVKQFLYRYVNLVSLMAFISLVGFLLGILFPQLFELSPFNYEIVSAWKDWKSSTDFVLYHYHAHGLFLFVLNENHLTRNCGIFTEPGIYQMILNSAIFYPIIFR